MKEIIEAGYALNHWFGRHNLDREGVRIVIQFPDERRQLHAEDALRLDATPDMVPDYNTLRRGEINVCGFPLEFQTKRT